MNKKFFLNLLIYFLLILGFLWFYFPLEDGAKGQPRSKVHFVYQQF